MSARIETERFRHSFSNYLAASLAIIVTVGAQYLLAVTLGVSHTVDLCILPALYLARRFGWEPGAAALVLGIVSTIALSDFPLLSFRSESRGDQAALLICLAVGGTGIYLADALRRARARARACAATVAAESFAHRVTQETLRKQQARLLDHAFDPILTWELSGHITYWNAGAEQLYGYTAEEAVGRSSHDLLQTVFPISRVALEEALRREGRWEGELKHRTKDGRWVTVDSSMVVVERSSSPPEVLEANRDITARKRAEEGRERLAAVVESSDDAIISKTLDGVIRSWNGGAERMFGYSASEAVGRPITLISPPERLGEEQSILASLVRGERVDHFETVRVAKGGQRIDISLTVSPVLDAAGHIIGASKVARNVSDRKRAYEALREASNRAEDAFARMRAVFLAADGLILADGRGNLLEWNPAALRLHGFESEDVPHRHATDFESVFSLSLPDGSPLPFESWPLPRVLRGEQLAGLELHVRRIDTGRDRYISYGGTPVRGPGGAIEYAVLTLHDVSARRRAEEALRERERLLRVVTGSARVGLVVVNDRYEYLFANEAYTELFELGTNGIVGRRVSEVLAPGWPQIRPNLDRALAGERVAYELTMSTRAGPTKSRLFRVMYEPRAADATGATVVVVVTDVTDQKQLEARYRQAQKMEAVGQLAGGVAHDFNNLLTVINGHSEVLMSYGELDQQRREGLMAIRNAGERAAGLTAQLLAFSRKAVVEPRVLDPNQVVESATRLLGRLIGENIRIETKLASTARVQVDPGQLDQVLMNLAVNARDAMPDGGTLTFETRDVFLTEGAPTDSGQIVPGRYVQFTVSDTGCGMADVVRSRIFEPFFTTKEVGKGTGLGLSTVYGVVRQADGAISVDSELGRGTSFRVLLPAVQAAATESHPDEIRMAPYGSETVLVVEDETEVRRLFKLALEQHGYTVIEANSGATAKYAAAQYPGKIDLLVTDVVMPDGGGWELAEHLKTKCPGIRVLFVSGYTGDAVLRHGLELMTDSFLQKPFTPLTLARKVREVLDRN